MNRDHAMITDQGIRTLVVKTAHHIVGGRTALAHIEGISDAACALGIADTAFAFRLAVTEAVKVNRVILDGVHTASVRNATARRAAFESAVFASFLNPMTDVEPTEAGNDRMHA